MLTKTMTIACAIAMAASSVQAQSSYPMLMDVQPLAAQVGATSEHKVHSRYTLEGAYRVIVTGRGVRGEVVADPPPAATTLTKPTTPAMPAAQPTKPVEPAKPADPKAAAKATAAKQPEPAKAVPPATPAKAPDKLALAVRFTVDADAVCDTRDFRIVTPQGVSTLGQLVLVRDPVVVEQAKNDSRAEAQMIKLPAAVCGTIEKAEDVDWYKFHVEAGKSLTFHVHSARCQDKIHDLQIHSDPTLTLRNASGTVLAASDNYFYADPLLEYHFKQAGDYWLEVRDVRYLGNNFWQYCIEINDRPLVTNVFPLALAAGKATDVELVGLELPKTPRAKLTLAANEPAGAKFVDLPIKPAISSVPVIVSLLPETRQTPGNDALAKAQPIKLPTGVNGRVAKTGELDYYRFTAKKGEKYSFEVMARRLESSLDPILSVLDAKGTRLSENDDMVIGRMAYSDPRIEDWTAPADGDYLLEVRDLHLRGGAPFVYYLSAERSEPYFTLEADCDKANLAPGLGAAIFVRAYRKSGFSGEIELHVEGLPPGVKATCGKILDDGKDGVIVLEAPAGTKHDAANLRITGTARLTTADGTRELASTAIPMQETYMPGGGRGLFPVELFTCCVSNPLNIQAIDVSPTDLTLAPGESKTIAIKIRREPGFDKNVTLDLTSNHLATIYGSSLPPGVTIDDKQSKTLLTSGLSEGKITIKAAADAKPVERQVVPVLANVSLNFVMKQTYAGKPLSVTIKKK